MRILNCLLALMCSASLVLAAPPDFEREVYPLLQRSCFECHGPTKQAGDLRLDIRDKIPARVLGSENAEASELVRRIRLPAGDDELMPAHGQPLLPNQQQILVDWIAGGAVWPADFVAPKHWAYTPPMRPEVPRDFAGQRPIDAFVEHQLKQHGLKPAQQASPEKLLRRITLDLIGLPPTIAEIEAFTRDPSDQRLAHVVDELLSRPQFGERWARPWLDAARFADSHGFQRDNLRDMWAYRDWVIRAFNSDMPFDQFTIEQLAGDLLPNATEAQKVATGFHRTTPVNVEAGSLPEETRIEQVIDRVNTTGAVWLGTTLECCQCHDHKYDPFSQREYYQLLALFNNTEAEAERKDPKTPSSIDFKSVSIALADEQRDAQRAQLRSQLIELETQQKNRRAELAATLAEWAATAKTKLESASRSYGLTLREFQSQGTTDTHTTLPDGAVLLQGNDPPDKDTYICQASIDLKNVRGFRLDVLQHESLPGGGPGRGDAVRRNFVLSTFETKLDGQPLKYTAARASFSQKNQLVAGAIDNNLKTGWAISPQFDQSHWAIFELSQPINLAAAQSLTFRLVQNSGAARTIGCFRISAITGDIDGEAISHTLAAVLNQPVSQWQEHERQTLLDARLADDEPTRQLLNKLGQVNSQLKEIQPDTTEVMVELPQPRRTTMFARGDYRKPTEEVTPGTPSILHPSTTPWTKHSTRLDLAKWLIDKRNPLVARVMVNRWWGELFGQGLVATPEDFGLKGERPTHPELLDWLAVEYMDSGWSLKHLLKTIVLSRTYQQSSNTTSELLQRDPSNLLLARGPAVRMDAEMIRDNALAISGLLNLKQFGPSIRPYQPEGIWKKVGGTAYNYEVSGPEERYRRGIYVVLKRGTPYPSFINFDASARTNCTLKRSRTNTPLQALTLLNDPVYVEAAEALAARAVREWAGPAEVSNVDRAAIMFRLCTSRLPTPRERSILLEHYEAQLAASKTSSEAWQSVAAVVLNLHETICKD